ncbi:UDP-N-acetylenolpyruvoylglucosamine reductase [Candidatus Kuenenbacteria bacterium RIFCSPHIGHO2_02_FULL_39_13]|uniref:UDP-N-acetylenolpyruvoylglucosamine reductase n=1 Tax=Candidatus Kuenenbacteria bacterium RIFCSPHIGHO2_02_FULL_39_13 TaxID=1798561 RepID=A0A1F6FNY0_9BACT|nr:MAG: UDP-N-acetylenolpyruvoylglucosamine reductase [Candidatus Kuenenbacteria bacterium RIFCSPHIGHO2_02_FULL_39_13]
MLKIQENYSLNNLTTIKVGGAARFFARIKNVDELKEALEYAHHHSLNIFVISGGSNVVVSDNGFPGLAIQININGFEVVRENKKDVVLKIGAGEVWDKVVKRAVANGWWGIENLSWIPGRIGACAVQNSGAYGQEISDVIDELKVLEIASGEIKIFEKDECGYGYRTSIFNTGKRDQYIIVAVVLKLKKQGTISKGQGINNLAKIDYPDVKKYFEERGLEQPSLQQIRQAIIYIRSNKLPDMSKVGNAGSFFKNIVVSGKEYDDFLEKIRENFGDEEVGKAEELKEKYRLGKEIKILTAWLIDICGLKGAQVGYVKVYEKQPLVLVTEPSKATADEVMRLFRKVRQAVYQKTGMKLLPEPRLVGFTDEELKGYFEIN